MVATVVAVVDRCHLQLTLAALISAPPAACYACSSTTLLVGYCLEPLWRLGTQSTWDAGHVYSLSTLCRPPKYEVDMPHQDSIL